jgi:putative DNA methylase
MRRWSVENLGKVSEESFSRFMAAQKEPDRLNDNEELRGALLDFIADFANWDNSSVPEYLQTSRDLTLAAHESLGGAPGTRPLVVDPFAGGGSIPIEALRVDADVFASDLNPVATLLNKAVLQFIPKYGHRLAEEVRKLGQQIQRDAAIELAEYPTGFGWRDACCISLGANNSLRGARLWYRGPTHSLSLAFQESRSGCSLAARSEPSRETRRLSNHL